MGLLKKMGENLNTQWRYSYTCLPPTEGGLNDSYPMSAYISLDGNTQLEEKPVNSISSEYTEVPVPQDSDVHLSALHSKYWVQYAAAVSASLSQLSCGLHVGWIGPSLIHLLDKDSPILITSSQSSWLASCLQLGAIPGSILSATLAHFLGRQLVILMIACPFLMSAFMISFAQDIYMLYAARLTSGMAVGASFTIVPMYIGEISSPRIRGVLETILCLQSFFGTFLEYCLVPFVSIKLNGLFLAIISVVSIASGVFVPESPYYYLTTGRYWEAENCLKRLRRTNDVKNELISMSLLLKQEQEETDGNFDLFTKKSNRRALIIIIIIHSAHHFSGLPAIQAYSEVIFEHAHAVISPQASGILVSFSSFFITIICTLLIDYIGRRPLLIFSTFSTMIPLTAIGTFFYLQKNEYENITKVSLLPLISFLVYNLTFGIGMGTLTHVYMGELFPTNVKNCAAAITSIYGSITGIFIMKLYQIFVDEFGDYIAFWGFAICCFIFGILIIVFIPETKGKSLQDIQVYMKHSI